MYAVKHLTFSLSLVLTSSAFKLNSYGVQLMVIFSPIITFSGLKDIFETFSPKIKEELAKDISKFYYGDYENLYQINVNYKSFDIILDGDKIVLNILWIFLLDLENYTRLVKPTIFKWLDTIQKMTTNPNLSDYDIVTKENHSNLIVSVILRCSASMIDSCISNGETESGNKKSKKIGVLSKSAFNAVKKNAINLNKMEQQSKTKGNGLSTHSISFSSANYYDKILVIEKLKEDFGHGNVRMATLYLNHTQSGYLEAIIPSLSFEKNHTNHYNNPKTDDFYKSLDAFNVSWIKLTSTIKEMLLQSLSQKINSSEVHIDCLLNQITNLKCENKLDNPYREMDLFKRYLIRKDELCKLTKSVGLCGYTLACCQNTIDTFFKLIKGTPAIFAAQDFEIPKNWDGFQISQTYVSQLQNVLLNASDDNSATKRFEYKFHFLELCNMMFVSWLLLLQDYDTSASESKNLEHAKFKDIGHLTLLFVQKVTDAILYLKIPYPTGSVSAWAFCTLSHVLDALQDVQHQAKPQTNPTPFVPTTAKGTIGSSQEVVVNVEAGERNELERKARLYGYIRRCLKEIGEVCGLMPDSESTPEKISAAINLLSGLGQYVDKDYLPLIKLRNSLESKEYYKTLYLEIAELSLISLKHVGRVRNSKLVGQDIAKFYLRMGDYEKAETFYQDFLKTTQAEGWSLIALNLIEELLQCRLRGLSQVPDEEGVFTLRNQYFIGKFDRQFSYYTLQHCYDKVSYGIAVLYQCLHYQLTKIFPLYMALATNTHGNTQERKQYAEKAADIADCSFKSSFNLHIERNLSEWGTLLWIDRDIVVTQDIVNVVSVLQNIQNDTLVISLRFGFQSDFPLDVDVKIRLYFCTEESFRNSKQGTSPTTHLSKIGQKSCIAISLKEFTLPRYRKDPAPSPFNQRQIISEIHGIRCENKGEVISSMYSPPAYNQNTCLPASNSLYTYEIPKNDDAITARTYLESCAKIVLGQKDYQINFLAKNNSTYHFTHLAFVWGDGLLSFQANLGDYNTKNCSLDIRKVRPSLYFEFGKDVKPDHKIVISPCEAMPPALVPLASTSTSPGIRSRGVSKVKPLAGIQQTWALVLTTGSFNIRPGIELKFTLTPGLDVNFPSLLNGHEDGIESNAPLLKFLPSKDERFSLEIVKEIPNYHTLIIPCQFYVDSYTSSKNIQKKKATPHTFDHRIEIFCPWERSRITQNLRFYQPFTVGHTVHTCGPDKKYVQVLIKCRTNEISFQLSQPELKCLNTFKEFGAVSFTNLNNPIEVLKITGNQSASYVWLLNSQLPTRNYRGSQQENPDPGRKIDALQMSKSTRASSDDRLDLAFTIWYMKCHHHQPSSHKVEQSLYTYLFDLVHYRTQFLVRTALVPPLLGTTDEQRASFLKVETPCSFTARIFRLAGNVDGDMYLKYKIICDPAVWAVVRDGTQPDDEDVIKVGSDPNTPATFSRLIKPLTRGYFPAPSLRFYIVKGDRSAGEISDHRQSALAEDLSKIDPLKSPLLTLASRIRGRTDSASLSSFYRKCSIPFKNKTRSLSKDANPQTSTILSSSSISNPKGNEHFEITPKSVSLINLGPAQVYNASLGLQYQVLPPSNSS